VPTQDLSRIERLFAERDGLKAGRLQAQTEPANSAEQIQDTHPADTGHIIPFRRMNFRMWNP
jgi:hypothetical protein